MTHPSSAHPGLDRSTLTQVATPTIIAFGMRVKWRMSLALAASVTAYTVADADAAAKNKRAPRLVVLSVKAGPTERKPFHRFVGRGPFTLRVTIKNIGKAAITKSASRQGVLESRASGHLSDADEGTFDFSRLGPGDREIVEVRVQGRDHNAVDSITTAVPRACVPRHGDADFNAEGTLKGRTSCAKGPEFAVIPRKWTGTMSVTHPIFGFAKLETDAIPTFTYEPNVSEHNNEFVYGGTGALIHSVSGSSTFCSIKGGKNGRIGPGEGFLVLDPSLLDYFGGMKTAEVYMATEKCNGVSIPTPIRTDGIKIPSTRRDENDTNMAGMVTELGLTFKWDIDAVT